MAGALKRKPEDQDMSMKESPYKKTRMVKEPKLIRWITHDFDQEVYTPVESPLPSPFGKGFQVDDAFIDGIRLLGPIARITLEAASGAFNRLTIRQKLRDSCSEENVIWADPGMPVKLKAGEGLTLTQQSGQNKLIRFRRVTSEYAVQWFAYIEKGTELIINGQRFPNSRDFVVGPFPSFSIVEYHDRVVFLYASRTGVDYTPSDAANHEIFSRILDHFTKGLDRRGTGKAAAASGGTGAEKSKTVDFKINVRLEPERQPIDVASKEYFEWRMQEWRILEARSDAVLSDAATQAHYGYGEWLVDTVMFRAIASVTTAIELENGIRFAQIDEGSYGRARAPGFRPDRDTFAVGHRGDLLLPFNTDNWEGLHWVLVHVKDTTNGPEIHCYDSGLYNSRGFENDVRSVVANLQWYGLELRQPANVKVTHHRVARQPGSWQCGYFTILNAWCVALGMTPSARLGEAVNQETIHKLIEMINLSMSGFMDSATIQAFLRAVHFVEDDSNTVADDRHFTRSIPFLSKYSMSRYVDMRRDIEKAPNSNTRRLDLSTVQYILEHTGTQIPDHASAQNVLDLFNRWLRNQDMISQDRHAEEFLGALSPISPAAITLAFDKVRDALQPPAPLPEDGKVLRKIWNLYHRLLKQQGVLDQVRQDRRAQKASGQPSTQEYVAPGDRDYPYEDPRLVVLDRLSMLPSTDILSPEEVASIRVTSNKKPTLKLKFGWRYPR